MTNEERKREKAVKKIETAVRKALGKGVSKKEIEDTVGQAIVEATEKVAAPASRPVFRNVMRWWDSTGTYSHLAHPTCGRVGSTDS